jgi:chromosome segregation ATPase
VRRRHTERAAHRAELEELRAALVAARDNAASAQDALERALAHHGDELERRDRAATARAAAHHEETERLIEDLEQVRSSLAAAEARADAADHRAASSESANKRLADQLARNEKSVHRLELDLARARATAHAATERAEELARRLDTAQTELEVERQRHGASLGQLHDQLAQLLARQPAPPPARTARKKNRSSPAAKTSPV